MNEHRFTDETATVLVLSQIVKDMHHLLDWLAIGLGCVAIANGIHAIGDYADREWIGFGFNLLLTASFAAWTVGTARRASRYQPGSNR